MAVGDGRQPASIPRQSQLASLRFLFSDHQRDRGAGQFCELLDCAMVPESIKRNSPISIARFLPFSRIGIRSVVSRRAILGISAAAFRGPRERRSVSIELISATVRGRT